MLAAVLLLVSLAHLECPATGREVLVHASGHTMSLCDGGKALHTYKVAIGSGGVAGKRVGWAQTPLGTFTLSTPRPSQYHLFIPLLNPDAKRFAAWAIGIHGPPRANKDDGASNVASDWTLGCIAVATDAEIDEVASWVRDQKVTRVVFQ